MAPRPMDSRAFLRIVAALCLLIDRRFSGDDEVVTVFDSFFGEGEERICGGPSMPKADVCGGDDAARVGESGTLTLILEGETDVCGGANDSLFGLSGESESFAG